jgi:hypothetical protein
MDVSGTSRTNDNRVVRQLHEVLDRIDNWSPQCFLTGDNDFCLTKKMLIPFSDPERTQLRHLSTPSPDRDGVRSADYQVAYIFVVQLMLFLRGSKRSL